MKSSFYASPLRVYLCLGAAALAGIWAGTDLPVSLFPKSDRPVLWVGMPYGQLTADEFATTYGNSLENQLQNLTFSGNRVEEITAAYHSSSVDYQVKFNWGTANEDAKREVQNVVNAFTARMPNEIRDGANVGQNRENGGFLAVSFYSAKRTPDELYTLLDPLFGPKLSSVVDAQDAVLWNPSQKEVLVELIPDRMATLGLLPTDVESAVDGALRSRSGGSITVGTQNLSIQMPKQANAFSELSQVLIATPSGKTVHLSDVARIDLGPKSGGSRMFKTSGQASLILFSEPKPGGNVKRMAEDLLKIVDDLKPNFPADVQYKVLVDPSHFIRNSIDNVFHEVLIGAILAVTILFLFIGSLKNTITAAIEIPLSMVLAFILMRLSGMNLNLVSLGGLALSAGMNVDASVVVMENIFRHFDEAKKRFGNRMLDLSEKLSILTTAVAEVRFAVIASTIASLVVFLPLAFTSDLTNAILGDLAKTVVFSHGFSAIVALVLVPTVRLQLMSREKVIHSHVSPIESKISWVENLYGNTLHKFLHNTRMQRIVFVGAPVVLLALLLGVVPFLPKEIIGQPDTDWMMLGANTSGNTQIRQMDSQLEEIEARFLKEFGDRIQYTFSQVNRPNSGWIMARLKNKSQMKAFKKEMEEKFPNTPTTRFWIDSWNPAEQPIPDPAHLAVVIRGGDLKSRAQVTRDLRNHLEEKKIFPRVSTNPNVSKEDNIVIRPGLHTLQSQLAGSRVSPWSLAELARVATQGKHLGTMNIDNRTVDIQMAYPEGLFSKPEDLASFPVGVSNKIVPFQALASVSVEEAEPMLYRKQGRELYEISARKPEASASEVKQAQRDAALAIESWKKEKGLDQPKENQPMVYLDDPQLELTQALKQLAVAVAMSIALIFVTMVLQFGSAGNALLVLVSIPLGLIGVIISLFVFRSTLSLNSVLGVILLNGISVANSIILVDFLKRLVDQGMEPMAAAVEAGQKRLRPILITSLTTILGMMPIAFGFGEGGKILQPLGIAVAGGLWVSMLLTLFFVPALQVRYLLWSRSRQARAAAALALKEIESPAGMGTGAEAAGVPLFLSAKKLWLRSVKKNADEESVREADF